MANAWDEQIQANPVQTQYSVDGNVKQVVMRSDYRTALIISGNEDGNLYLTFDSAAAGARGICVNSQTGPLCLTIEQHGRLLRGPIYAVATVGTVICTVWEAIHPCPCLQ